MNRKLSRRHWALHATALGLLALSAAPAWSQAAYPDKPTKILVGYPPGQTVDIIARAYAAALTKELGRTVIHIADEAS